MQKMHNRLNDENVAKPRKRRSSLMKMGIQSKRNAAESQRKKSPNRRSLIRVTNFERLLKIWTRKPSRLKRLRKSVASGWKRLSARKSSRLKRTRKEKNSLYFNTNRAFMS